MSNTTMEAVKDETDARPGHSEHDVEAASGEDVFDAHTDTQTDGETADPDFFPCLKGRPSTDHEDEPSPQPVSVVTSDSDCYDTSHKQRGLVLVINQERFSPQLRQQGLGNRPGSDVDEKAIKLVLEKMGFFVTSYPNLKASQMRSVCSRMASNDHTDSDCFICVILSHGEEGIVYGTDKPIEINELTKYFKGDQCPSLIGKPKLFFIQACRGYQTDPGVEVSVAHDMPDAPMEKEESIRLPVDADCLYAYSTVPGYYSWRNGLNGSWFMQALCQVLKTHGETLELRRILTKVNGIVAQKYESFNPENPSFHQMKQIPCIVSKLTKDVYFPKKKNKRLW